MARPRKDYGGPSAVDRMLFAFWQLMEEGSFESVTVGTVIARSGVSPNTFYYHFDSFEDLLTYALDEILDYDLIDLLVMNASANDVQEDNRLSDRFYKVVLYATSGSGELTKILQQALLSKWLQEIGVEHATLSEAQLQDMQFIFAGIVSLLATVPRSRTQMGIERMRTFYKRPLGQGSLKTIVSLLQGKLEE